MFHRITLSARAGSFGGIVMPICFAVLRLTTNSNFVGCSTGRSAGSLSERFRHSRWMFCPSSYPSALRSSRRRSREPGTWSSPTMGPETVCAEAVIVMPASKKLHVKSSHTFLAFPCMFFLLVIRPHDLPFGFELFQHRESKMKFELTDELKRHQNKNTLIAVSSGIRASLEPKPLFSQ